MKTHCRKRFLFLRSFGVIIGLVLVQTPLVSGYEIRGTMEQSLIQNEVRRLSNQWSFVVNISGDRYSIRIFGPQGFIAERCFDSILSKTVTQGALPNDPDAMKVSSSLCSVSIVETNEVPGAGSGLMPQLWLAFASQAYLKTHDTISPVWPGNESSDSARPMKYHLATNSLGQMARLEFLSGYTNAVFLWNDFTHVAGCDIAREFRFVKYAEPEAERPPKHWVEIVGKVDAVIPDAPDCSALLKPVGRSTIYDLRFKSPDENQIGRFYYNSTNSEWLEGQALICAYHEFVTTRREHHALLLESRQD
ncbi:MAG TPA: hypothetical protein PK256_16520 [Verrucomicrobiota bacterium]|nr:hypothetical protein [Verrucomicrobiota bacterium]